MHAVLEPPPEGTVSWLQANLAVLGTQCAPVGSVATGRVRCHPATTVAGFPSFQVRHADGRWATAHSTRDPWKESERWLADAVGAGDLPPVIFIVGSGLGYLVATVLERSVKTRVIAIEPTEELAYVLLAARDWREALASGRLRVLAAPSFAGVSDAWRALSRPDDPPLIVTHPVIALAFPETAASVGRVVARIVSDARMNAVAEERFAAPYLLNTLRNLDVLLTAPSIDALNDRFPGVPAIVFAAGPSLNHNLTTLGRIARLRERALLIAVDTALRPMVIQGLAPHLVVSVDPSPANARTLLECPPADDVRLVAEGSLDRRSLRAYAGRTWLFRLGANEPWPWLTGMGLDPGYGVGWGSVLVSAFDLAARLGTNHVVLAGADLAFTNGQPYARDTIYESDWARAVEDGLPLDAMWRRQLEAAGAAPTAGIDGPTLSAPHLAAFRDRLIEDVRRNAHIRVTNGTGAGLLQGPGIEQASLAIADGWPVRTDLVDLWSSVPRRGAAPATQRRIRDGLLTAFRGRRSAPDGDSPMTVWQRTPGMSTFELDVTVGAWLEQQNAVSETEAEALVVDAFGAGDLAEAARRFDRTVGEEPVPSRVLLRAMSHLLRGGTGEALGHPHLRFAKSNVDALLAAAAEADESDDLSPALQARLLDSAVACAGDAHRLYLAALIETFVRPAPDCSSGIDSVRSWRAFQRDGYFDGHPAFRDRSATYGTQRILELLKPSGRERLLELGCGYGRLLSHLLPHVGSAVGVEAAAEPLISAREFLGNRENVSLVQIDGITLWPLASGSVDRAVAFTVLQHLPRAATRFYLFELRRVLTPSGLVCVQVRTGDRIAADVTRAPHEQSISHGAGEIAGAFEAAGFDILSLTREILPSTPIDFLWVLARAR